MVTYKIVDFKFDMKAFAISLRAIPYHDINDFAAVIGIDDSTLRNWIKLGAEGAYKQPAMNTFLAACNALDLDPRQFFVLVEGDKEPGCEQHGAETVVMSSVVGTLNHGATKIIRDMVLCRFCGEIISTAEYTETPF